MLLRFLQVRSIRLSLISAWVDLGFCRMGKPLPESIYKEKTASRMGLNLPRGPDPRSFNPALAITAATGRTFLGMEM